MYRVIECLTQEHNYVLVCVAAMVCIVGSSLSARKYTRLVRVNRRLKHLQIILTSVIAGATIWSTHFIAMLAYEPGYQNAYEPLMTATSLAVAILGMLLSNIVLAYAPNKALALFGGVVFGLTVSAMHYVGMLAYQVPGRILWHSDMVVASVILSVLFGIASYHRILKPYTRYCWLGAALFMVLGICAMHFTGMSAVEIQFNPLVSVPEKHISDSALGMVILAVTGVILLIGFASISIETSIEYEAHKTLKYAARHDSLTGLPNRLAWTQEKADVSQRLEDDLTLRVAVLTIDLNLFKEVNDLYGHTVGDDVLIAVAGRFVSVLEEGEFLARSGGDEFVALKSGFRRTQEVVAFAERLATAFIEPLMIGDTSLTIGAAIGVATSVDHGRDIEELQHKSDLAMYRAKSESNRQICVYDAEMDEQSQDKLMMVQELRQALGNDEFELAYQLQNDVSSLDPIGFEALLRWNNPKRGRVSPAEFIPLAEETGLIRDIGLWVLRTACHEAMTWPDHIGIAVNVAPQQLIQPSFLEHVSDILLESRLPPERLELEITEESIIDDKDHTLKIMYQLKAIGVRIAMDDFGTGYSSLATLRNFPFDKIKIDRCFIQDVHCNEQSAAIVRSTLLLGQALKIPVLAEGVELEGELAFLQSENCSAVQGFYFGKPMTMDQVRELMAIGLKKSA